MSAVNQKKHLAGFTILIYTRVPTAVYRRGTAPYPTPWSKVMRHSLSLDENLSQFDDNLHGCLSQYLRSI